MIGRSVFVTRLDVHILGGVVLAVGVFAFGAVIGWWALSLVGWRPPSRRALFGATVGIASTVAVVVLLTGPGQLALCGVGVAVGATAQITFLAATARSSGSRGPA